MVTINPKKSKSENIRFGHFKKISMGNQNILMIKIMNHKLIKKNGKLSKKLEISQHMHLKNFVDNPSCHSHFR